MTRLPSRVIFHSATESFQDCPRGFWWLKRGNILAPSSPRVVRPSKDAMYLSSRGTFSALKAVDVTALLRKAQGSWRRPRTYWESMGTQQPHPAFRRPPPRGEGRAKRGVRRSMTSKV